MSEISKGKELEAARKRLEEQRKARRRPGMYAVVNGNVVFCDMPVHS